MNRIIYLVTCSALVSATSAALAHPGDHSGFGWSALGAHLLEPDHLIFLVMIVAVGLAAFRAGRRAERRAQERSRP